MTYSRRSVLSALGVSLPFGLGRRGRASTTQRTAVPTLRFRSFEEAVRGAFNKLGSSPSDPPEPGPASAWRRIEVGHSDPSRGGVQGCHNDRPFAGFPAGHLRIIRAGAEPGPVRDGVRLYIATVDVALTGGLDPDLPIRALDFASLPPAPVFGESESDFKA